MTIENKTAAADKLAARENSRRGFIATTTLGLVGGAAVLADAAASRPVAAQTPTAEPLIDKWMRTKVARVGAQLSQVPLGFIDPQTKEPAGFNPSLFSAMVKDIDPAIKIEWTNLPFGELIPAWLAGKFDMLGQSLAALPARALRGWFCSVPCVYSSGIVAVRKDSPLMNYEQLNSPSVKFAVLQGGSEAANTRKIFPKAQVLEFQSAANAGTEVTVGRADAMTMSAHNVPSLFQPNPDLRVLSGPPVYLDPSTLMLPQGDLKTLLWMNNWLQVASTQQVIADTWKKWFLPQLAPYGLKAVVVGPMGAPVEIETA